MATGARTRLDRLRRQCLYFLSPPLFRTRRRVFGCKRLLRGGELASEHLATAAGGIFVDQFILGGFDMAQSIYNLQIGSEPMGSNARVPDALTFPAALLLAELNLTRYDCAAAKDMLSLLYRRQLAEAAGTATSDDAIMNGSLFRDGIVQFVACFGAAVKGKLPADDVYAQVSGGPAYLQWLQDLRDTYAAHSFGPQRQSIVSTLPERAPDEDVIHFGIMAYQGVDRDCLKMTIDFIELGITALDERNKQITQEVIAQVNLMSEDAIHALPPASFHAPAPDQLRMSRKGYRSTLAGLPPKAHGGSKVRKP